MNEGLSTLDELYAAAWRELPSDSGIYVVQTPPGFTPEFICPGSGGWFKGKDPNVSIEELTKRWVEGTRDIYIGAAKNLRQRVRQLLCFGHGEPAPHRGGRYLWQLRESRKLLLRWYRHPTPYDEEARLIGLFVERHSVLPFANLKTPKALSAAAASLNGKQQ